MPKIIKDAALSCSIVLMLVAFVECSARAAYYQHKYMSKDRTSFLRYPFAVQHLYHGLRQKRARVRAAGSDAEKVVMKDAELGYKNKPGQHQVTYIYGQGDEEKRYQHKVTVTKEGLRYTTPAAFGDKPEIWIFGGSITFGQGLNDEETFAYLLQERFSNLAIRNFGTNGYGIVHWLRLYEQFLDRYPEAAPLGAIFIYGPFHDFRNDANADRLEQFGDVHHLRASLNKTDGLVIDTIAPTISNYNIKPKSRVELQTLSAAIFRRIARLCRTHNVQPVIASLRNTKQNPVLGMARQEGFQVLTLTVPFEKAAYQLLPFDRHPNAKANKTFSDQLAPVIVDLMKKDNS